MARSACHREQRMADLPPSVEARRSIEDRAIQLSAERHDLDTRIATNTQAIIDLLLDAEGTGTTFEQPADLIGVSRQTLYRWREVASRLNRS